MSLNWKLLSLFSTVILKGSSYTAFTFNNCFLRLISIMGGEKDLSASITRAFLVEEMSRDGTGSLLPFVKLPTISLFQILGIAARTPAYSRKVERTPYLHLKFSNERNWPWVFRRSLILCGWERLGKHVFCQAEFHWD